MFIKVGKRAVRESVLRVSSAEWERIAKERFRISLARMSKDLD